MTTETDTDDRPTVAVGLNTTVYPNAVVITVELTGGDADARDLVEKAIMMALKSVVK
jgi:hypothetical protein